jgi:hypothetical protein
MFEELDLKIDNKTTPTPFAVPTGTCPPTVSEYNACGVRYSETCEK